jgi:hypothetical protein
MTHGANQALAAAAVSSAQGGARWWFGEFAEVKATAADTGPDPATG